MIEYLFPSYWLSSAIFHEMGLGRMEGMLALNRLGQKGEETVS